MASGWKVLQSKLSSGLQNVDISKTGTQLTKSWGTFTQSARERLGTSEDITELPEDYKALEKRTDALRSAHASLLRVVRVYETSTYDYPMNLGETASELGQGIGYNLSFWAAQATKGTNLPQPAVANKPTEVAKTLPHALSRAAASGAIELGGGSSAQADNLSKALQSFAVAEDKIGTTRLAQDQQITNNFLRPWNTLTVSLQATMKSRQNVRTARLDLDSLRSAMKGIANGDPRAEQMRLEVEQAEEKLFNATEEAIKMMRGVLESPEAIKAIAALVKAQKEFYSEAASILSSVEGELEATVRSAEDEFRKSRA